MAVVPARQLQLFPSPKPLLQLFGDAFFRAAPAAPGVYIMTGKADRVLYVGQSGNLRHRLATYKNCNPNQLPRRIIRLIHQVQSITWEAAPSVRHARLRENELLRLHRPKFNVMNVYPRAYPFIGVDATDSQLILQLTTDSTARTNLYGAFKGSARPAFSALARSIWTALHQPASLEHYPCGIFAVRPPRKFTMAEVPGDFIAKLRPMLDQFLEGISSDLILWLDGQLPLQGKPRRDLSPFQEQLHASDLSLLSNFFETGPLRNARLRQQNRIESRLIPQETLDDYIAGAAKR